MKLLTVIGLLLIATSYSSLSLGAYPRIDQNDSAEVKAAKFDAMGVFNAYEEYPGNSGDVDCDLKLSESPELYEGRPYRVCTQKASETCSIISHVVHRDKSGIYPPELQFITTEGAGCRSN